MYSGFSNFRQVDTISARDFSADPNRSGGTQPTSTAASDDYSQALANGEPPVSAPHPGGSPIASVLMLLAIFAIGAYIIESQKEEVRGVFRELKISVWNVFMVTLFAVPGLVISKTLVTKYLASNNPVRKIVLAA